MCPMAPMEESLYEGTELDALGAECRTRLEIDEQWTRSLVELGSVAYESGVAEEAVGPAWTGVDTGYDKPT